MIHVSADKIRTDEMSLVTILIMNGYMPCMSRDGNSVVWEVSGDECDEDCGGLVDEFVRGACRVEPRRYIREYVMVRKDMYKFLGIADSRTPKSVVTGI